MSSTGGRLDEDLLFDPRRYGPYAAAHHVAGHHWSLLRQGVPLRSAGLPVANPSGTLPLVNRQTRASIEAASVLTEALAIEAVVHRLYGWQFGIDAEVRKDSQSGTRRDRSSA